MAFNYAAYGSSYGQYAGQASTMNAQQQSSATGYPYGQAAASAYSVGASTTTTTAPSAGTQAYGNTASVTTTAAGGYNYAYNYNYTGAASNYNAGTAQANMQAFQQSWYGNSSTPSTSTTQQTATTAQAATAQQQAYGQYLQQYQQQMSAYQQYANAGNVAANPASATAKTDSQSQQQKNAWSAYNQIQQRSQQALPTSATTDYSKAGWGNYQQKMGTQQTQSNQQKSTGVVYRTPMKYSTDTQQYIGSNASQSYNQNQAFKSGSQTNSGQTSYSGNATTYNQGYSAGNQSYGNNHPAVGSNMQSRQASQQQKQQYGQRNQSNMLNYGQNQGFQQNQGGQSMSGGNYMQNRGGFTGNMNMRGGQQHGGVRSLMTQRSPMGGGNNMGGYGGSSRDGSSIPPFPRAWHGQDQSGPRNFKEPKDRWGGPGLRGPGGFNPNQQHQTRMMYSNNMRNPKGSNRELWSPAQKPKPLMLNEGKSPITKSEEVEKIDKDKLPEIKSYLYAWLGARHSRPTYDIRQVGERPNIMFRCDLRVEKYSFVGVGKAPSKKEAQTLAAWKFAEYLVKIGEIQSADLPSKQQEDAVSDEIEGDIGDVNEQNDATGNSPQRRARKDGDDFRNRNRDRKAGRGGPGIRGRGGRRGNQPPSWGGPPMDMPNDIQPLMSVPVVPWGTSGPIGPPMGGPARMMAPPPLMDFGPPFWEDGWSRPPTGMGPGHMGPPMGMRPPYTRRSQNDFWRRRDIEERMMDLSRGGSSDWAHPEDMFISQMIRNQQEAERRQRGQRGGPGLDAAAIPGEWERVQQQARPVITSDDRHVMEKHAEIYPQEGELKHLHRVVNTVEQALKLLSDKFVDEDHPKEEEKKTEEEDKKSEDENKEKDENMEKDDNKEKEENMEKDENKERDEATEKQENEEEGEKESEQKETTDEKNEADEDAEKKEEPKKEEKRAKIKILKRPKKTPKVVDTRPRVLCGVNRIGPLAKGLLITKDCRVDLVLLCGEIPTTKLLDRIMEHIEDKLTEVDTDLKLVVERKEDEAGFLAKAQEQDGYPIVEVSVLLTAMALRKQQDKKKAEEKEQDAEEAEGEKEETVVEEPPTEPDPVGMLPKPKMLEALACLRHTHWFQAKACMLQSCVILTRILRDLRRRDEDWNVISEWGLEVLIYNCLTSSEEQMSPGDACRRFFEVVAGGILLSDMPGILDPCDRNRQRDILDCLTEQHREDLTRKAQKYLRNLAFREIHLILGMDKLPSRDIHQIGKANTKNTEGEHEAEEKDKVGELNNIRKRRFEANGSDGVAESPKRSLTDEEDTDARQNMAELCISDENSEGKVTGEETGAGVDQKLTATKDGDSAMDVSDAVPELTKEEEDALLEDDERMDT